MILKKYLFLLFFAAFALQLNAQFEIKTNVLGLANNNYNAQVELLLNDKSGLDLEVSYRTTPWILAVSGSDIKNNTFRALIAYKYYLGAEDPTSGIYFGPYLRLKVGGLENIPVELDPTYTGSTPNPETVKLFNNAFTAGITGGQKILFDNNFIIEYYAGIGYDFYNPRTIREDLPTDIEDFVNIENNSFTWPWDFRLGISIGYRIWR